MDRQTDRILDNPFYCGRIYYNRRTNRKGPDGKPLKMDPDKIISTKGELVVDPEEAEIVKIIFDKFVNTDMGADSISDYLNDHGYTKNTNRDFELNYFTRGHIMKILDNPVSLGKIAYGRYTSEKIKGTRDQYHRVHQQDYLLAEDRHDAIIDEETWNKAREKRIE